MAELRAAIDERRADEGLEPVEWREFPYPLMGAERWEAARGDASTDRHDGSP